MTRKAIHEEEDKKEEGKEERKEAMKEARKEARKKEEISRHMERAGIFCAFHNR
jgi:hypothetical protein